MTPSVQSFVWKGINNCLQPEEGLSFVWRE